jgi:hypothetical protein
MLNKYLVDEYEKTINELPILVGGTCYGVNDLDLESILDLLQQNILKELILKPLADINIKWKKAKSAREFQTNKEAFLHLNALRKDREYASIIGMAPNRLREVKKEKLKSFMEKENNNPSLESLLNLLNLNPSLPSFEQPYLEEEKI